VRVAITSIAGNEDLFRRFISQLWRRFINVPALDVPRVHLGKTWQLLPRGADYTRQAMGPELDLIKVVSVILLGCKSQPKSATSSWGF